MDFCSQLFAQNHKLWQAYLTHPFVKGLGQGILDVEKFKYYMIQDYLYLKDYIKVFALGLAKSQDDLDFRIFSQSIAAILDEMDSVHFPYMKELGIRDEEVASAVATLWNTSYTKYMLARAYEGNALDAYVAILSCSWSYAWIAAELLRQNPGADRHEIFGPWIKGYTSEGFTNANNQLIQRINELTASLDTQKKKELAEVFRNCSLYEMEFWNMSYSLGKYTS